MSDFSEITSKVRNLLGDIVQRGSDIFVYGNSDIFTLTEDNISEIVSVYNGTTELASGDFSYDTITGKLTLSNSGNTAGDIIEIIYNYYPNYSDTHIEAYIRASLTHISTANYYTFEEESGVIYPEPEEREQNLIALIASILIDPKNVSYRLPDINVIIPTGSKGLSVSEQIKRVLASFKKDSQAGAGIWGVL